MYLILKTIYTELDKPIQIEEKECVQYMSIFCNSQVKTIRKCAYRDLNAQSKDLQF